MSALQTGIEPLPVAKPAVIARLMSVTISFEAGTNYAQGRVGLLDEDNNLLSTRDVSFTADELASWAADDSVVMNAALAKLSVEAV